MAMIYCNSVNYDYSGRRRKRVMRAKRKSTPLSSFKTLTSSTSPLVLAQLKKQREIKSLDITDFKDLSHMKRKETNQYTGDELLGIATMHKSNAVPVSKNTDAKIFATMRRN